MAKAKPDPTTDNNPSEAQMHSVERINAKSENHKTLRYFVVCVTIMVCVVMLYLSVDIIFNNSVVDKIIAAVIAGLVIISVSPVALFRRIKKFTNDVTTRQSELEQIINPDRTTSGLNSDGSGPHD